MIVSFKVYVMNFVDFVFDFYSHITSHVSQAFISCTHYTSYSLLNFVHIIVCVFGLTNQVWKYFEFYAKQNCSLRIQRELVWKSSFWKTGFKSCVFEAHFISYSCIYFIFFNALRRGCIKFCWFSKIHFFSQFQSIKSVFRSIEITLKILGEPLSVSINRN